MKNAIKVSCRKSNLTVVRDFVSSWLSERQITGVMANQIVLAVDEACANSIIHQHQCDGVTQIEVGIYQKGSTVHIEIKDKGQAFPIDSYQPHAINEIIRKRNKGGMGIFLIRNIMDEIEVIQKKGYYIYKFAKHLA